MQYTFLLNCANAILNCFIANETAAHFFKKKVSNRRVSILVNLIYVMLLMNILISNYEKYLLIPGMLIGLIFVSMQYEGENRTKSGYILLFMLIVTFIYTLLQLILGDHMFFYVKYAMLNCLEYITLKIYEKIYNCSGVANTILMIALPVLFLIMMIYVAKNGFVNEYQRMIMILCIVVINMIIVVLYNSITTEREKKLEQKVLVEQNESYKKQIQMIMDSNEMIHSVRHDMKNHIMLMNQMIKHGEYGRLEQYLNELECISTPRQVVADTGNFEFDAILNHKIDEIQKKNIDIDIKVTIPSDIGMKPFDMAIIIGNLFDNAMREVEQLPTESRRIVSRIRYEKDVLMVRVQNPCKEQLTLLQNRLPGTTKREANEHGIGLKNVKKTVEKYNGEMNICTDHQVFDIFVTLYL